MKIIPKTLKNNQEEKFNCSQYNTQEIKNERESSFASAPQSMGEKLSSQQFVGKYWGDYK